MGEDSGVRVTRLLQRLRQGDPQAEARLISLVYREFRQMAGQMMQGMGGPQGSSAAAAPPPIPAAPPWYYVKDGQTVGPIPADRLMAAVQAGDIGAQTLVWCAGMSAWSPAASVPILVAQFQTPPPPPPPS